MKLLDKTFLKFLLVGVANTLVGTAVMFAAYNWLGLSYWLSSALNYVVGSVLSFFLNKKFTFHSEERGIVPALRFAVGIVACYLVSYGAAKPLVRFILKNATPRVRENIAMAAGAVIFFALNYLCQRFFTFRKKSAKSGQ